jgi:hypothetical protein
VRLRDHRLGRRSAAAPPDPVTEVGTLRTAVYQAVLVVLGVIVVLVVVGTFISGSRSYLLLPLAILGAALVVTGALLEWIILIRYRSLEIQVADRRRRDETR